MVQGLVLSQEDRTSFFSDQFTMKGYTMSEQPTRILHQADVEDVIGYKLEEEELIQDAENDAEFAKRGVTVIASPAADAAALKVAVDEIRAALTASGVTA